MAFVFGMEISIDASAWDPAVIEVVRTGEDSASLSMRAASSAYSRLLIVTW